MINKEKWKEKLFYSVLAYSVGYNGYDSKQSPNLSLSYNIMHRPPGKPKNQKWMPKTNSTAGGPHEVHWWHIWF